MGAGQQTALGRQEKVFVAAESAFATFAKPAADDAIKHNAITMSYTQERVERASKNPETRSVMSTDMVSRRKELTWNIDADIVPSGTAGDKPDMHELYEGAMGTETVTPATSVAYTLSDTQQLQSLQITREISQVQMNVHQGCYVNEMTLSWSGAEEAKVSFSGGAKDEIHTFRAPSGSTAGGDAYIQLAHADYDDLFEVNSVVAILNADGTLDSNTGTGYKVIAVDTTNHRLQVEASITTAHTSRPVVPYTPTETVATTRPVTGIVGTCSIGGEAHRVISCSITLNNGVKELNDEFGYDSMSDYLAGVRRVTVSMQFRMQEDILRQYPLAKAFTAQALSLVSGALAAGGSRVTAAAPIMELKPFNIDAPEEEEVTADVEGMCLGSSGEDEFSLTFD